MKATANLAAVRTFPTEAYPALERAATTAGTTAAATARNAREIATLCAAPFIGLVYVVTLPFIGLGALLWLAAKALAAHWKPAARGARNVALFLAAPFIGLAYAVALPFVGIATLGWWAVRAATGRTTAN